MVEKNKKKVEIKVSGMNCASCALNVEKSLNKLEGVKEAHVNIGTEKATVEYDPEKMNLSKIEKAVEESGYKVVNKKVILKIGGMSCVMCVKAIEDALGKLDGISKVTVNLTVEKAYVTYNSQITSITIMKNAIEDLGYQYLGVEGEETEGLEEELKIKDLKTKRNRMIVGFGFGIPLEVLTYVSIHLPIPISLFIFIVSIIPFAYVSYPIFSAGFRSLRHRNLDMDVMYSMGIGVAYVASVLGTFSIVLTPNFLFYGTALILAAFLTMGRYLETRAKGRTSTAIKSLIELQSKTATILRNNDEMEIPIEDVQIMM